MKGCRTSLLCTMCVVTITFTSLPCNAQSSAGAPPKIEQPERGVWLVYDDNGNWGGPSMGTTHQHRPEYQAMKLIDLSQFPADAFKRIKQVRLRVFMAIQDWSFNVGKRVINGLDEAFELRVNDRVHTYRTNAGFPARAHPSERLRWDWHDFILSPDEVVRGINRFVFKKAKGDKYNDYIYIGIDNTVKHGNSAVSFDGGRTWRKDVLNTINATGEYMVRLLLIEVEPKASATWNLRTARIVDTVGVIGYAGCEGGRRVRSGLQIDGDAFAIVEFERIHIERQTKMQARIKFAGAPPIIEWRDERGKVMRCDVGVHGDELIAEVAIKRDRPMALRIQPPRNGSTIVRTVTITFTRAFLPTEPVIDMAPRVMPPAGKPAKRPPRCVFKSEDAVLENPYFRIT
ncbi:MAG TPA: hypothetical protein EYP10_12085 [Armatimonadetes bacterium]|nr:hypothetical protein [Armatimonadota bacterium]